MAKKKPTVTDPANGQEGISGTGSFSHISKEIAEELIENGTVRKTKEYEADWSRATAAVKVVLETLGFQLAKKTGEMEVLRRPSSSTSTTGLRSDVNRVEKKEIGQFVASYLNHTEREVFLGTGSTVLSIGKYITEGADDRYSTINIPLAAEWCYRDQSSADSYTRKHPPKKITLLGGVLDTSMFRYPNLLQDEREFAITVFGADGVRFSKESCTPFLRDPEFAKITNDFIKLTQHTVIVCIASEKIQEDLRQTGPVLTLPEDPTVRRVLVTEREPETRFVRMFEKNDWIVITPDIGWPLIVDGLEPKTVTDLREWVEKRRH